MLASDPWFDWVDRGRKGWWIDVVLVKRLAEYSDTRDSKLLWDGTWQIVGTGWMILSVVGRTIAAL